MMNFLPDEKVKCPATGFAKSCKSIVVEFTCPKFVQIRGTNPQGGEIDQWGCADSFLPLLLIENSQMTRQTGAAVESFRNEMVKANETGQRMLLASLHANQKIKTIEG